MPKFTVENSLCFIEEGKHVGELTEIVESTSQYGPTIKFLFKITDVEVTDSDGPPIISGLCSAKKLTPSTKLFEWLQILSDGDLEIGDDVEVEDFLGTTVELKVENTEKDDGSAFSNVKKLLRLVDPPV